MLLSIDGCIARAEKDSRENLAASGEKRMSTTSLTRRAVLKAAALTPPAIAASFSAPFVHGAYAAGTLSVGTWDHWVPGASQVLQRICQQWAEKEKVDLKFDLITSNGDKDLLTLMAEGQARSGHDIMGLRTWYVYAQKDKFVPVDDIMDPLLENTARSRKRRNIAPRSTGAGWPCRPAMAARWRPPCARIDYLKEYAGLDVRKMYPGPDAQPDQEMIDKWTWEYFLDGGREMLQSRALLRPRAQHLHRFDHHGGIGVRRLWRVHGRCEG